MSFKVISYDKNNARTVTGTYKTLKEALAVVRPNADGAVEDRDGFNYFRDGTGLGFSALRQSNEGMQFASTGIYNQHQMYVSQIKHIGWSIFWKTKDRKLVRRYFNEVRRRLKAGTFKIKAEKQSKEAS